MRVADFVGDVKRCRVERDRTIEVAALPRDVGTHDMAVTESDAVRDLACELFGRRDALKRAVVLGVILMRACNPSQHGNSAVRIVFGVQQ